MHRNESAKPCRGRATPIDPFTSENQKIRFDDWLPCLKKAAEWNGWSKEEQLLQLAGHLLGRALQEWNLLNGEQVCEFHVAVKALQERLDPGSRVLAGQDFGTPPKGILSQLMTLSGGWNMSSR